jgi:hypothetical protein
MVFNLGCTTGVSVHCTSDERSPSQGAEPLRFGRDDGCYRTVMNPRSVTRALGITERAMKASKP